MRERISAGPSPDLALRTHPERGSPELRLSVRSKARGQRRFAGISLSGPVGVHAQEAHTGFEPVLPA
jgi:hypothetical protein